MAALPRTNIPDSNGLVSQLSGRSKNEIDESHFGTVFIVDSNSRELTATAELLAGAGLPTQVFPDAERFLRSCKRTHAGCILLELRLDDASGLDVLKELGEQHIRMPVIFVSAFADVPMTVKAIHAGAWNVLEKPVNAQVLLDEVQRALQFDAQQRKSNEGIQLLSERELEVLDLLLAARGTKQIAQELNIGPKTVEKHRANILSKLQVDGVTALLVKMRPSKS